MYETLIASLATIAAMATVAITLIQWKFDERAKERQRDVEMTKWANSVIDMMAELETACAPIGELEYSSQQVETISHHASALLDKGRLFFPNVPSGRNQPDDEGTRVEILDQVLRACYIARHVAAQRPFDGNLFRRHVWQARRKFVNLVQKEMGASLRMVVEEHKGELIDKNPEKWSAPKRELNLPERADSNRGDRSIHQTRREMVS